MQDFIFAHEIRKRSCLKWPAHPVIIWVILFTNAVFMSINPRQIGLKPLPDTYLRTGWKWRWWTKNFCTSSNLGEVKRIDNTNTPTFVSTLNSLAIKKTWIHFCAALYKPGFKMCYSVCSISLVFCNEICRSKRAYKFTQPNHGQAMVQKKFRVRLTISSNEGTVRILWVRPPIITLWVIIVPTTSTSFTMWWRYCFRRFV